MAADYRHIGGRENRLGRHYSRFSTFWPAALLAAQRLAAQRLARRKSRNGGSNRRSYASDVSSRRHGERQNGDADLPRAGGRRGARRLSRTGRCGVVHRAIRGQTRPARSDHAVGAAPGPNAIRSDLPVLGQMSHGICRALVGVLHGHERAAAECGIHWVRGNRRQPHGSFLTPRWRKPDSNSRSRKRPPASLAGFGSLPRPTISRYREIRQRRLQGS
jgi:hypothetical protein